MISHVMALC